MRHFDQQSDENLDDPWLPLNDSSAHPSSHAEEPFTNKQLLQLAQYLISEEVDVRLIVLRDLIEGATVDEPLRGDPQAQEGICIVQIHRPAHKPIEEVRNWKGQTGNSSDSTTNHKLIYDSASSPSTNNFGTESQLNKADTGSLETPPDQLAKKLTATSSVANLEWQEPSANVEAQELSANGDVIVGSEPTPDNGGCSVLKAHGGEKRGAEESRNTEERQTRSVPADLQTMPNESAMSSELEIRAPVLSKDNKSEESPSIAQTVSAVRPLNQRSQVQYPINKQHYTPPGRTLQPATKRGPKPYVPPRSIAEACEERLQTSLREIIPWLNNNPMPARPAQGTGTYYKAARAVILVKDANKVECKMVALDKLLSDPKLTTYTSVFRTSVELIIDQERKNARKPAVFEEVAGAIDAAVLKSLRRRIGEAKKAAAAHKVSEKECSKLGLRSDASGSDGDSRVSSILERPVIPTPLRRIQDSVFSMGGNEPSNHFSMTESIPSRPSYTMPSSHESPSLAVQPQNYSYPLTAAGPLRSSADSNIWAPSQSPYFPSSIASDSEQIDHNGSTFIATHNCNGLDAVPFSNLDSDVGQGFTDERPQKMGFGGANLSTAHAFATFATGHCPAGRAIQRFPARLAGNGSPVDRDATQNSTAITGSQTPSLEQKLTPAQSRQRHLLIEALERKRKRMSDEDEDFAGSTKKSRIP